MCKCFFSPSILDNGQLKTLFCELAAGFTRCKMYGLGLGLFILDFKITGEQIFYTILQ